MVLLHSLLHDTIHEIHSIDLALRNDSQDVLRSLVHRVILNLFILLDLGTKHTHELKVSTAVFPDLTVKIYGSARQGKGPELTPTDICLFIQENVSSVTPDSVYLQLLSLLSNPNRDQYGRKDSERLERRPARIRDSYALILTRFAGLVLLFIDLRSAAESQFLSYLTNCYAVEQQYYALLQSPLEVLPDSDTEKILYALDTLIQPASTELLDSMFSYDEAKRSNALDFSSSDESFNKLYSSFLHLALLKPQESFREHSGPFLKVMLGLYKKLIHANFIEVTEDHDAKLRFIADFICESDSSSSYRKLVLETIRETQAAAPRLCVELLPIEKIGLQASTGFIERTLSGHLPELLSETLPEIPPGLPQELTTKILPEILTDEALNLISEVRAVFDSLRESGFELDPFYPALFRYYLILVHEQSPDAATSLDSQYIRSVAEIIRAVIDYEKDEDNESALLSLLHRLHEIQAPLVSIRSSQSILMKATLVEYTRTKSMMSHSLRNWNLKALAVNQLELICEEYMGHHRLLKRSFSKWYAKMSRNRDLIERAAIYSNERLVTRYFNDNFIKPLLLVAQNETRGDIYILLRFFGRWSSKLRSIGSKEYLIKNSLSRNLCRLYLRKWYKSFTRGGEKVTQGLLFREKALQLENSRLLSQLLLIWREKLLAKYPSDVGIYIFEQLDFRARRFALRKPFFRWVLRLRLIECSLDFKTTQRHLFLLTYFSKWATVHKLVDQEQVYTANQEHALKSIVFCHWKADCENQVRADAMYRRWLLSNQLKNMRLVRARREMRTNVQNRLLLSSWCLWKLGHLSSTYDVSSIRQCFQVWKIKSKEFQGLYSNAESQCELLAKKKTFVSWNNHHKILEYLTSVADLNFQRNILNRVSRKIHQHKVEEHLADTLFENHQKSQNYLLLKYAFEEWRSGYHALFESKAQALITHFQENVTERRILSRIMRHWRRRARYLLQQSSQLQAKLATFQRTSSIVRVTLQQWIAVTEHQYDISLHADELYISRTCEKVWRLWLQKYGAIATYLTIQADNILDRKDYDLAVSALRKWYYKYATVVSATDNICKTFLKKKKRLNLKIMFELWMHKYQLKRPEYAELYKEANTTFGSNVSPLARKNIDTRVSASFFGEESYFYTPLEASSPYTPVKNKNSPTRLQETNQRIKLNRMDALTRRFRRANLGDDFSGALRKGPLPRLSPPKRNRPFNEPPPAPDFNGFQEDPSHILRIVPASADLRGEALQNSPERDDGSLIETAKSLQRIRPIVIPYDESPSELRYSTLRTLKDRLQSAQSSPKRSIS